MTLIVEDDSGRPDANSYIDAAGFRAKCQLMGRDASLYGDDEVEPALARAFLYINANWKYRSAPLVNEQAGEFPRANLSDGAGRVLNTVPGRVKDAQCELAWYQLSEGVADLYLNLERGGAVQSEAVGPIHTIYRGDAPAQRVYGAVERLLHPFVRDDNEPYKPLPIEVADDGTFNSLFGVGMHDTPGAY